MATNSIPHNLHHAISNHTIERCGVKSNDIYPALPKCAIPAPILALDSIMPVWFVNLYRKPDRRQVEVDREHAYLMLLDKMHPERFKAKAYRSLRRSLTGVLAVTGERTESSARSPFPSLQKGWDASEVLFAFFTCQYDRRAIALLTAIGATLGGAKRLSTAGASLIYPSIYFWTTCLRAIEPRTAHRIGVDGQWERLATCLTWGSSPCSLVPALLGTILWELGAPTLRVLRPTPHAGHRPERFVLAVCSLRVKALVLKPARPVAKMIAVLLQSARRATNRRSTLSAIGIVWGRILVHVNLQRSCDAPRDVPPSPGHLRTLILPRIPITVRKLEGD